MEQAPVLVGHVKQLCDDRARQRLGKPLMQVDRLSRGSQAIQQLVYRSPDHRPEQLNALDRGDGGREYLTEAHVVGAVHMEELALVHRAVPRENVQHVSGLSGAATEPLRVAEYLARIVIPGDQPCVDSG